MIYGLYAEMCGRGSERPVYDIFERDPITDGHNLLTFFGCNQRLSMGDMVRVGSNNAPGSAAQARVVKFTQCTFHGSPEWIDGWQESNPVTGFTETFAFY